MRAYTHTLTLTALTVLAGNHLSAGNWPQWRGPAFNGSATEKNSPTRWTRTEGLAWTAPMPGPSGATPAIWNDHVFVSSTDDATKTCVALALDRKTGRELWRVKATDAASKDDKSTFSSPSPVTDGRHV